MASPIQIVLNPENYEEAREAGGGGGRKDFFAHRDAEFRTHRDALIGQIETISGVLSAQSQGDVGYVKVILRREAWAKLNRPVQSLFRSDRTPVVGGGALGVMHIEARQTPTRDRKSVVSAQRVSVRIDIVARRNIKTQTTTNI